MSYSLWSRGRLLGHTDLDIPCVQSHLRQGFVEPTAEGTRVLPDAVGVSSACAATSRWRRDGTIDDQTSMALFDVACNRREALELELRDENGDVFECDFMRVYDLRENSFCTPDDREEDYELDPELQLEVDEMVRQFLEDEMYRSSSIQEDERWETMQYHIQVFLKSREEDWLEDLGL